MTASQTAPYPSVLATLVSRLTYKKGWSFYLDDFDRGQGCEGLTLSIFVRVPDSNDHDHTIRVHHPMPVPPAAYNEQSWCRWLLQQILLVEQHEACEFFKLDDERPYAPNHGPGYDPYQIRELTTDEARRTTFRGELSAT